MLCEGPGHHYTGFGNSQPPYPDLGKAPEVLHSTGTPNHPVLGLWPAQSSPGGTSAGIAHRAPWSPGCPVSHTLDKLCWGMLGPQEGCLQGRSWYCTAASNRQSVQVAGFIKDSMHTVAHLGDILIAFAVSKLSGTSWMHLHISAQLHTLDLLPLSEHLNTFLKDLHRLEIFIV